VIFVSNSFSEMINATVETKCLSPAEGGNISDCFSLFHSKLSWRPKDTSRESRVGKVVPWADPLLLSWAELWGWREFMARGKHFKEAAVPRSSSSAKPSRAEGTARRQRGERREAERG